MFRSISNFISKEEVDVILAYNPSCKEVEISNEHIRTIAEATNGYTVLCDLTKSEVSKEVSEFQGDATLVDNVPSIFHELSDRISKTLSISAEHVFFQYIVLGPNGMVKKHYDAGKPGYVTYKCNICVSGPDKDVIWVDKSSLSIAPMELYCFEANLYKHWMDSVESSRVHLSYGFLIPYSELGWTEDSPRVRMSNRIWRAYIGHRTN
jgi:hypothetical protein